MLSDIRPPWPKAPCHVRPCRRISLPSRKRTSRCAAGPPSAQVIRFPSASDSLTKLDLEALAALTSAAHGEWRCETERDGNWGLSAILVPSKPEGQDYAAFLVCRSNSKLLLIDARLSARWRRLGVFDDAEALALALAEIMRTTAVAPKRSA
jgi:hypothetical protein